jgi:hypothetical protein
VDLDQSGRGGSEGGISSSGLCRGRRDPRVNAGSAGPRQKNNPLTWSGFPKFGSEFLGETRGVERDRCSGQVGAEHLRLSGGDARAYPGNARWAEPEQTRSLAQNLSVDALGVIPLTMERS